MGAPNLLHHTCIKAF
ncbi:hypothetical protein LINGRAHAP2_LOCUS22072 [Linum grandiflorum]